MQRHGHFPPSSSSAGRNAYGSKTVSAPLTPTPEGDSMRFQGGLNEMNSSTSYKNASKCASHTLAISLPSLVDSESTQEVSQRDGCTIPTTSAISIARPYQQIFFTGYGTGANIVHSSYGDEETTDEGTEECSTSPASSEGSTAMESEAFNELMRCCIAEKVDKGVYECCPRKASGIWLSETLRESSALKRFPFVYNTAKRHYYVCLYHRRVIRNEPALAKGESLRSRELSKYEQDMEANEEELKEIADDPLFNMSSRRRQMSLTSHSEEPFRKHRKRNGKHDEVMSVGSEDGSDSDMSTEYTELRPRRSARHQSNGSTTPSSSLANGRTTSLRKEHEKSKSEKPVELGESGDEDLSIDNKPSSIEVPFSVLSAASLRRYKKYFKLSHRSGASTKQQLLDGVAEHFGTLQVPAAETAACLIYAVRMNRNKLDYPINNTTNETNSTPGSGSIEP
uniref:Histone deacetylase complex subunit SAP30 Sin3 binding domain-containing protein n=1 Tax=Parascaris univalens TaxID=6257 RepID=A0A915AMM4_PARUN